MTGDPFDEDFDLCSRVCSHWSLTNKNKNKCQYSNSKDGNNEVKWDESECQLYVVVAVQRVRFCPPGIYNQRVDTHVIFD